MHQREISLQQLYLLSKWLESEPEVPNGPWFKRFPEMSVCGEAELVKTSKPSLNLFRQEIRGQH